MVHITDYDLFHERDYYEPGDTGAPVFQSNAGKIGVAICYDRHFPEYMRALAVKGAEIVVIPQAGLADEWPEGLYEAEMRAAAFTNGYFTVLANRVGTEGKLDFSGQSFACSPNGTLLAQAPYGDEAIIFADLDLQLVQSSHARTKFLPDRRRDLYADWI